MTVDALTRTFAAELRAIDEGHHAFADPDDGRVYTVVSDVRPDEWRYTVRVEAGYVAHGAAAAPIFSCDHLRVQQILDRSCRAGPGLTGCKHAALVARRLEREGAVEWHEHHGWIEAPGTSLLARLRPPPRRRVGLTDADDPFKGL